MHHHEHHLHPRREVRSGLPEALAEGLGWFSLGLGLAEVVAPHVFTRALGLEGRERLLRSYGLREIASGAGILATSGSARAPWMWGRVGGDALDIATVAGALNRRGAPTGAIGAALVAQAGVALVDAYCAQRLAAGGPRRGRDRPRSAPLQAYPPYPVRYSDAVETIDPDEEQLFERIIQVMAAGGERVRERHGRALRTSHAKAHGLLRGELRVEEGLPAELRQGLFAEGRSYPVIVRLAQVPGELLDDRRVSTPRGMAIKILDVPGEKLPGHAGETTQDFVLDTGRTFISATARTFLMAITGTEAATPLPEAAKSAVSTAARATNAALNAVGLNSAKLDFYGHPRRHPLSEAYYSQCPFRYGAHIAKLAVIPDLPELLRLAGEEIRLDDENGLRTLVSEYFRDHSAEFIVAVQLCTDLDRMPVEDASAEWPESESPYRPVARLILPPQPAYDAERRSAVDENLSFCPSHSLAAHRPLGSIMRARMHAYEVLGRQRREINGRPTGEPRGQAARPAGPSA